MLIYRPGFEESPSEIELLVEKTDKIYLLYARNNITIEHKYHLLNDEYIGLGADVVQISDNSYTIEEIPEDSKSPIDLIISQSQKRKSSLLKRSTSEPRLNKLDSENTKSVEIKINKIKSEDICDDPYNEAYFHIFENMLNDYLLAKTKQKYKLII